MSTSRINVVLVMSWIFLVLLLSSNPDALASSLSFSQTFPGVPGLTVAAGDFNGDGKRDLAVSTGGVAILLGDGSGSFGAPAFFDAQDTPKYLAVGDFNRDGKLDLAVPNYGSNSVSILLGDGTGNFSPATHFSAGDNPNGLAVGDFNRDGKLDVVVTNTTTDTVSVLLGDGTGGFLAPATFPVGFAAPIGIAVADFNKDGKLDLAVAGQGGGVSVLFGNGLGGFESPPTNLSTDGDAVWVAVGDFNQDGALDLVAVNEHFAATGISILLGNGLGGFGTATHFPTGGPEHEHLYIAVGDFDRDGNLDLAVAHLSGPISILRGNGIGGFEAPEETEVEGFNQVLAVDLNGDCKPDLLTAVLSVGINTTIGSSTTNTTVFPGCGTIVNFSSVSIPGETNVTTSSSGQPVPAGFSLGSPPTYYDFSTTAVFTPPVTICITYDPTQYTDVSTLQFLHYESNAWVDVTISNDIVGNIICGEVSSLSLFVIAERIRANIWVGLKNSDDVGIRFDLLAELYKNASLVGSGQVNSVRGGSSGFNNAKLNSIPLILPTSVDFSTGDTLSIKLYVRNACIGSGKNSGRARLWYNDTAADSHFNLTIGGVTNSYFLLDGFALGTAPGPGPKKTIDVAAGSKCSAFKPFGTWSITP
jgi:hypothetical protein